ncbi:hypothetical protein Pint_14809 [Pistacia integerrima]|uniref:Uncharacterized protein n=1 Tax=Pistacia integerrima TaxID=434235 RepID=A0ACC0ZAJ6_9ROSI|nr:hypothetical protein Pint_14809 [Pistacia integerrima]
MISYYLLLLLLLVVRALLLVVVLVGGGGSGSGSGRPLFCNTSNQVGFMSDIYDVVGVASASGSATNTATALFLPKSLNSSNFDSSFSFNSSVGEMAASVNVRLPFTAAQLQELERQTTIFKYMMASIPVPNELLFAITKTPSILPPPHSNMVRASMELGVMSHNSSDPEPWRCRRTDGKKWRCSRDVIPDQKYCERHSHKSRPRSRKPVELPAHQISKNDNIVTQSLNLASNTINRPYQTSHLLNQTMGFSALSSDQQPRCLEWFMKGETIPVANNSNQEWPQMLQSKLESKRDSTMGYGEHLFNSNSYINFGGDSSVLQAQGLHDQYNQFFSPKLVSHQTPTQQITRHFIDAWSIGDGNMSNADGISNRSFVSCNEKLPQSSLTLSMSGGSEIIERNENVGMSTLGTSGSETENVGTSRPHWMNHISGMGSTPGGPLAEALCLGIASSAKSDSNEASPHDCSTSTTTSSSKSSCGDGGRPGTQF